MLQVTAHSPLVTACMHTGWRELKYYSITLPLVCDIAKEGWLLLITFEFLEKWMAYSVCMTLLS